MKFGVPDSGFGVQGGKLLAWFAMALALLLTGRRAPADDRFPPYDNTEEKQAAFKANPQFYQFKTLEDLPKDLKWETGEGLPDLGDPAAKKGGTLHLDMPDFPPTLRFLGPDGNNTFRGEYFDYIELGLVDRHPNVDKWMPALAQAWAVSPDRMTVYYKLDPEARYSDGEKVTADDWFTLFYVSLSPYVQDPFPNDFFKKEYASITKYSDQVFSITLKEARPDPINSTNSQPLQTKFFREFTDDFPARYQWRKMPTTGAYDIKPEDIRFGRSIAFTRVKNWWAKDRPYYRYRFNVDRLEYRYIASPDSVFELFRQGKIDFFSDRFAAVPPLYWYDKSEIPEVQDGYIERGLFYNVYPRISRGIYLNQSKPPLDNLDVRLGINYAMDFAKVIDVVFRGDAVRMQSTFAGFGRYTDPKLRARPYDVAKAQEYFAKAGYTKRGGDGVLMNAQGKRLSLTFSIPSQALMTQLGLILKEDALKAGLELNLEALDYTQLFKKGNQKQHEMIIAAWGPEPPYPRVWEYYHSDNAYQKMPDGTRKPKPNTNNFTMTADPELDKIIELQRAAPNEDEVQRLSWQVEDYVQEHGAVIPAYDSPYYRYLHWRWMCWPKDGNLKATRLPLEKYVFWIDEDKKAETKKAMSEGKSFGEVSRVFDQYRDQ